MSTNFLNLFSTLVAKPTGMWQKIIMAFENCIGNYAAAIIVLTLVIKFVLLPLDYLNKVNARKTARINEELKPEMDKLREKFGHDRKLLNAKTGELYKKANFNPGTSILLVLANLAITLTVFITLFKGLNSMAAYKTKQQYEDIKYAYISTVYEGERDLTDEQIYEKIQEVQNQNEEAESAKRVLEKYEQIKDSFLWIDNVWIADSPLSKNIMSYSEYLSTAKLSEKKMEEHSKDVYNTVMEPLNSQRKRVNGYLVLPILAMGIMVVSQFTSNKKIKLKKKESAELNNMQVKSKPNIVTMLILGLLYGYMTFKYNSVFSLYIIVGTMFTTLTTPFINTLADVFENRKRKERKAKNTVSYSRKNIK